MRKLIVVIFLVIGILCGVFLYCFDTSLVPNEGHAADLLSPKLQEELAYILNAENQPLSVLLSHNEFFYNHTINVSITASKPNAVVYYTLDSSTPTAESTKFTSSLELVAGKETSCIVLKAIAINDTEQSAVLTHSFFIGTAINNRFSTYVFSLSSEDDGLYGYENGILVRGKINDDFLAENPDTTTQRWEQPSNYTQRGREWERLTYVEAFTQDGRRIIAQNAGMRVYGGATRASPQKSLQLIARKEYEPDTGKFKYDFFRDDPNLAAYNPPILSYDALILRNDGNEYGRGRLRTPLATWIAREAGFSTVSPVAAAAVFINGEYYGYACLNVNINEQFLEDLYKAPERSFEIIEGGNHRVMTEDEELKAEFARLMEYAEEGFSGNTIQAFHNFFDVDNYLLYYAIQLYICNSDWPGGNIKIWRYTGDTTIDALSDELDGRWRFVLYDLDITMNYRPVSAPTIKSIHFLIDSTNIRKNPIFKALLQRPEYAEKFSNYMCDLISEHFSVENARRVTQELDNMNLLEQKESLILRKKDYDSFILMREPIFEFLRMRPSSIYSELKKLCSYSSMYTIRSDGSAKINTLNGTEGSYFIEASVPITPVLEKGRVFDHWLINGSPRYDEELRISFNDADADGQVFVQLVTHEADELPPLFFKDTYDTGTLCGFTMYNPTSNVQKTQKLYLSDNYENLNKCELPSLNVQPGTILEFAGKSSTSIDALLKFELNFNPKHGEIIYLSNEAGVILDSIVMHA